MDITIDKLISNAAQIIPPVWPLQTFVACNPLYGMEFFKFEDALAISQRFFYGNRNQIDPQILYEINAVNRELIKWCHAFLDNGQATIAMPARERGFYHAWSSLAPFDKNLHIKPDAYTWITSLPTQADQALLWCFDLLDVQYEHRENYLRCALAELPGWAGYIKWRSLWQHDHIQHTNQITLLDFLAVRLAITYLLTQDTTKSHFSQNYEAEHSSSKSLLDDMLAKEEAYRQDLLKNIVPYAQRLTQSSMHTTRSNAQLIFCIDVRSEPLRRRIENLGKYETFSLAGFFGVPVCLHSYNDDKSRDSHPALLKSRYQIYEKPIEQNPKMAVRHKKNKSHLCTIDRLSKNVKCDLVANIASIDTMGIWCGLWMTMRTLAPKICTHLQKILAHKFMLTMATEPIIHMEDNHSGIPFGDQVAHAESTLRTIGLTANYSQIIILCGHAGNTENNTHASAYNCGACSGNHGGPNAKILAAILNDDEVRKALTYKDIVIPDDTIFIAAQHNTTTDDVVIYDQYVMSDIHATSLNQLKTDLIKAGNDNSQYRCSKLDLRGVNATIAKKHVLRRSIDWSESIPEWGLAGNAAFIIGPRTLTKEVDLQGRCFLHSYDWTKDQNSKLLESILTTSMVTTEWINTQYLFSTIDNITYGSGSKITHNIVGKFGVVQGNGSDLMHGLPLQLVNCTDDLPYHDPIRLQVVVYATRAMVKSIIQRQSVLQKLFFNHWVILLIIDPQNGHAYRLNQTCSSKLNFSIVH